MGIDRISITEFEQAWEYLAGFHEAQGLTGWSGAGCVSLALVSGPGLVSSIGPFKPFDFDFRVRVYFSSSFHPTEHLENNL